MLSAKKVSQALQRAGINVSSYQESQDPKIMDGEVTIDNGLSVQVGFDYGCVCRVDGDQIDYLLEVEEVVSEDVFAAKVVHFLNHEQH